MLHSMCFTYFYWHAKNVQFCSRENSENQRRQKKNMYILIIIKKMYFVREADWKFNIKVYNIWYKTIIYVFQ